MRFGNSTAPFNPRPIDVSMMQDGKEANTRSIFATLSNCFVSLRFVSGQRAAVLRPDYPTPPPTRMHDPTKTGLLCGLIVGAPTLHIYVLYEVLCMPLPHLAHLHPEGGNRLRHYARRS